MQLLINGAVVNKTSINYSIFGYANPSWDQQLMVSLLHTSVSVKLQLRDSSFFGSDKILGEVDLVLKNILFRKRIRNELHLIRGSKQTKTLIDFDICIQVCNNIVW